MAPTLTTLFLPLLLAATTQAQQVYISTTGSSPRPSCTSCYSTASPTYRFTEFSFTQTETYRTATSRPSPTTRATYAEGYEQLSSLVPGLSTTTVSLSSFLPDHGVSFRVKNLEGSLLGCLVESFGMLFSR